PFRNFVHPRLHADGEIYYLSISGKPVFDGNGNFTGYRGAGSDVTERRRAQDALQQLEERLSAFIANSPNAISLKKPDGRYVLVNRPYERIIGATNDEIRGKTSIELFGKEFAQSGITHDQIVLETGQVVEHEEKLHLESGEYTWLTVRFPIFDSVKNITAIGAVSTDITERKQVESLKSEIISVVSHELRTPMTSIFGSLSLIYGGMLGELSEELAEVVEIAYHNTDRLIRLTNDILDIQKIEAGKMIFRNEPLDLCHLIEQSIAANRPYREERRQHKRNAEFHEFDVKIKFDKSLPDAKVYADPDRLAQVMDNLLSNAAKFSPPGGTVEISVSRHNGSLRVAVSDQGPGIPAEAHEQIFDKFFQVDRSDSREKHGTGLGLSICRAIIEELGGTIGFDPEAPVGATLYFDLPEHQEIEVDNSREMDTGILEETRLTAP
ncbi:MAG: ATP-binding protein, partial [Gammaproteobacteria bacterium]|nr:ATP-binding protein [Gammaproteobacteria bacterium]